MFKWVFFYCLGILLGRANDTDEGALDVIYSETLSQSRDLDDIDTDLQLITFVLCIGVLKLLSEPID